MSGVSEAAPLVKVRARTKIVMDPVRRRFGGIEVRGRLVDAYNSEPVPDQDVRVRMSGTNRRVRTDRNGVFEVSFSLEEGRYDILVEFAGSEFYTESSMKMGDVDVNKESIDIVVSAGESSFGNDTVEITVRASTDLGGVSVKLDLFAGSSEDEELGHAAALVTNGDGYAPYLLPRELLGEPGRKRVLVRFLGDDRFNPAEADTEFLLTTRTFITFVATDDYIDFEGMLSGSGRVTDGQERGVANEPVALVVGSRQVGQALTDENGYYEIKAAGSEIGTGRFNVQAVLQPSKPWYRNSRSDMVQVEVGEPDPVPVTYTLAAFGATLLAMLAFLGLRTKPWQGWFTRVKKRVVQDNEVADVEEVAPVTVQHGLQLSRPGIISSFRRPHEDDFNGVIRDAFRKRPLDQAVIRITHATAGTHEQKTQEDGRFAFKELQSGEWRVAVRARGYITEEFAITIPHRGELLGAQIDMLSVRERIFALYREVAQPLLPSPGLWGVWTPRQIFKHVRAQRPASALSVLTDFVEESYFSQRTPTEEILGHAEALLSAAKHEQGTGHPAHRDVG